MGTDACSIGDGDCSLGIVVKGGHMQCDGCLPSRLLQSNIPDGMTVYMKSPGDDWELCAATKQSERNRLKRARRAEEAEAQRLRQQALGIQTLRRDEDREPQRPLVAPVAPEVSDKSFDIVRAIVDSGAEDTVTPPGVFPSEMVSSPMSRAGRRYRAANGAPIENMGQTMALFTDAKGRACGLPFQVAKVERPLISVTQLSDSGHETLLGRHGGVIRHVASGRSIPLRREGGVYILEMRVARPEPAAEVPAEAAATAPTGFTRPVAP